MENDTIISLLQNISDKLSNIENTLKINNNGNICKLSKITNKFSIDKFKFSIDNFFLNDIYNLECINDISNYFEEDVVTIIDSLMSQNYRSPYSTSTINKDYIAFSPYSTSTINKDYIHNDITYNIEVDCNYRREYEVIITITKISSNN